MCCLCRLFLCFECLWRRPTDHDCPALTPPHLLVANAGTNNRRIAWKDWIQKAATITIAHSGRAVALFPPPASARPIAPCVTLVMHKRVGKAGDELAAIVCGNMQGKGPGDGGCGCYERDLPTIASYLVSSCPARRCQRYRCARRTPHSAFKTHSGSGSGSSNVVVVELRRTSACACISATGAAGARKLQPLAAGRAAGRLGDT